jgi:hypothetical protein
MKRLSSFLRLRRALSSAISCHPCEAPHARLADEALATLDAEEPELLALLAYGEPNAVAGLEAERVDLGGRDGDRHLFHRGHAERGDGLMANEDEIRCRAGDELALDFVGGGPEDGPPQARREGDQQPDEQQRQAPARLGGRGQRRDVSTTPSRSFGALRAAGRRLSRSTCRRNPRGRPPTPRGTRFQRWPQARQSRQPRPARR